MNQSPGRGLPKSSLENRLTPLFARILVWGSALGILYLLRSFFLLLFLTFVFAYVQSNGVDRLGRFVKNRSVCVVIVGLGFLSLLIALGVFLVPQVESQTKAFANRFGVYVQLVDQQIIAAAENYPLLDDAVKDYGEKHPPKKTRNGQVAPNNSITLALIQTLFSPEEEVESGDSLRRAIDTVRNIGGRLLSIGSAFLLALLLSFLIVFDLPRLTRSVHDLRQTKLQFAYHEIAHDILGFSRVLGQALEAQLFIAIVNMLLTSVGIAFLGLTDSLAFLSVIVFICSFVPVVGVFISSIPICLVALQTLGLQGVMFAILLIVVIHVIEGYVLNPRIYGSRMRINPVIVLVILTIGGKLFHVWGLILGVPVCTYFFQYAIRDKTVEAVDRAP